jgi:SAM-dependent methyltransferase
MKKYALLLALTISSLNGMDNQQHINIVSRFLKIYDISLENRAVFHIGCTTGKRSAKLAEQASRVHVFDQNQHFINTAQNTYQNYKNLTFECCNPMNFNFPRQCNLAIIDYTIVNDYTNIKEHKKELFQCMHQHLLQDGEILFSITTSDNTPYPNINAAKEMAPILCAFVPDTTEEEIIDLMIPVYPSLQELLTALEETGFEIITHKEEIITKEMNEKNFINNCINGIAQNPIYGSVQDPDIKRDLISHFLDSYVIQLNEFIRTNNLQKNNENNFLEPTITTIIHARKK